MPDNISEIITGAMETAGDPIVDTFDSVDPGDVVADDAPADDTPADDAPADDAAPPAADGDTPPPAADTPPPAEAEVPDLSDAELNGKVIPVPRHKAVLTKARKETEALKTQLKDLEWASTVPDAKDKLNAIQIAETNPELFAEVLLKDAKFAPIFERLMGAKAAPAPAAEVPAAPKGAAEKPQPDVLLPDGSVGYSQAVQEQLFAWHEAQLDKKYEARMNEKFSMVDPILKERQAQTEFAKAVEKQKVHVAKARKEWPQFEKHEKEIAAHLNKPGNEQMTLDEGYRAVVIPKLQADRDAMRKEILAEQGTKKAAAPLPVTPGAKVAKPVGGKESSEDIIRRKMAELGA